LIILRLSVQSRSVVQRSTAYQNDWTLPKFPQLCELRAAPATAGPLYHKLKSSPLAAAIPDRTDRKGRIMNQVTNSEAVARRAAVELRPLAAYLDDHDAGRMPANAAGYQAASQKVRLLLAPHLANPHVRQLCHKSQSLYEILGNLLIEQEPGLALEMECALEEAKLTAYWLQ
jgi:hypothetical protein